MFGNGAAIGTENTPHQVRLIQKEYRREVSVFCAAVPGSAVHSIVVLYFVATAIRRIVATTGFVFSGLFRVILMAFTLLIFVLLLLFFLRKEVTWSKLESRKKG